MSSGPTREEAASRVAERFTRIMRATMSPYGMLTDPPLVWAAMAVVAVPSIVLGNLALLPEGSIKWVVALIASPPLTGMAIYLVLAKARDRAIDWLMSLPFTLDNINALLSGAGTGLLLRFDGPTPSREVLTELVDSVHEECFALEFHPDHPEVELRIGVADSKLNPAMANHRRFQRVRAMLDALISMSEKHPIQWVRVV